VTRDQRLISDRFPRASQYHPAWVLANASGGANSLWLTEWLATALDLRPGMRVLDLGCGRASSSIFLCREFGVQVWAVDLWISAAENIQRIRDAGVEDGVFPLHADARSLPFAPHFFDAILCVDSFYYYGTDDLYLNYNAAEIKTLEADAGRYLGYVRVVGRRRGEAKLEEYCWPDEWVLTNSKRRL